MISAKRTQQRADASAQPTRNVNPEINARLETYMAENPGLVKAYENLPKSQLVRKLCLSKMFREEVSARKAAEKVENDFALGMKFKEQIKDPKLDAKVEKALANEEHPLNVRKLIVVKMINAEAARRQLAQVQPRTQVPGMTQ